MTIKEINKLLSKLEEEGLGRGVLIYGSKVKKKDFTKMLANCAQFK